jgi:hypothetical protein
MIMNCFGGLTFAQIDAPPVPPRPTGIMTWLG